MKQLSKTIVNLLKKKKLKISFAESCTGGLLSSSITSIRGSSKIFNLGLVTYSNKSKIKSLKISKKIIKKYGAVSKQVCIKMLIGLNKISKTNIAVSTTGIAGPSGGSGGGSRASSACVQAAWHPRAFTASEPTRRP